MSKNPQSGALFRLLAALRTQTASALYCARQGPTLTGGVAMPVLAALGIFALLALSIACFAAYRINAKRFEFAASIWKLFSLRITIASAEDVELAKSKPELKP